MPARKTPEQELLEAKLRFERAWEKKKDDIRWRHEVFWPTMDAFTQGELAISEQEELERGE